MLQYLMYSGTAIKHKHSIMATMDNSTITIYYCERHKQTDYSNTTDDPQIASTIILYHHYSNNGTLQLNVIILGSTTALLAGLLHGQSLLL